MSPSVLRLFLVGQTFHLLRATWSSNMLTFQQDGVERSSFNESHLTAQKTCKKTMFLWLDLHCCVCVCICKRTRAPHGSQSWAPLTGSFGTVAAAIGILLYQTKWRWANSFLYWFQVHSTSPEVCPCIFTTICLVLHQLRSSCSFCLRSSASFSARRAASLQGPEYHAPRRVPVSTNANEGCYDDCSYIDHTTL